MSNEQPQPSTSNASPQYIETQRRPTPAGGSRATSARGRSRKERCEPLEKLVIAKKTSYNHEQTVAIRIRAGTVSYAEWMNEVQVYLLPNFNHPNILPLATNDSDKCNALVTRGIKPLKNFTKGAERLKLEYWITLKYDVANRTLREHLMTNVLTWEDMLKIANGIIMGINYLHENQQYQNFDVEESTRLYVKSTRGLLKRVVFQDTENSKRILYAYPAMHLSVIHRNLSSQNIILKPDLTPCIWNFGCAHIQHPFQPIRHKQKNLPLLRSRHLASPYSAPEVLMQMSPCSMAAFKAIDMYAYGIILWELISRCELPQLDVAYGEEQLDRSASSRPYQEPYEDQLGPQPTCGKLFYAVCRKKSRPRLRVGWMAGDMSHKFVRTIQELWDHDYDARLHSATIMERFEVWMKEKLEVDQRCNQVWQVNKTLSPSAFDTWTLDDNYFNFETPISAPIEPNICFLSNRDKSVTVKKSEILLDDDCEEEDNGYTSDTSSDHSTLSREHQALSGDTVEWIEMVQRARKLTLIEVKEEPKLSIKMD